MYSFDKYRTRLINHYKVEEQSFDSALEDWKAKFGQKESNLKDFIWSLFQQVQLHYVQTASTVRQSYEKQRDIYLSMFEFLIDTGRDRSHILGLLRNCDLKIAEDSDFKMNVVLITTMCCEECEKLNGQILPLEEALMKQPLPHPGCTKKFGCICSYGFEAVRDGKGRLIHK